MYTRRKMAFIGRMIDYMTFGMFGTMVDIVFMRCYRKELIQQTEEVISEFRKFPPQRTFLNN